MSLHSARMRRRLVVAGVCVSLLYLATVTGRWWPTPDSAMYLGLARSLADGQGYRFNGYVCTVVAPGLPAILAVWSKVFGDSFISFHLLMAICGLGSLWVAYRCLARLGDERMAFVAVLATALSYTYFHNSHRILTDIPFAFLFWVIFYCVLRLRSGSRWWLVPVGVLTASAIIIRLPGLVLMGPFGVGLALDRWKGATAKKLWAVAIILGVAALLGIGGYLLARTVSQEVPYFVLAHVREMGHNVKPYLVKGLATIGFFTMVLSEVLTSQDGMVMLVVSAPALLLMCVGLAVYWRRGLRSPAVIVALYAAGLTLLAGPEVGMRPRYFLPVQPLVILAVFEGLLAAVRAYRWGRRSPDRPAVAVRAVLVAAAIIVATNAPRLGRDAFWYSYLSYRSDYYQRLRGGQFVGLHAAADWLRANCGPRQIVGCYEPSVLHYLSGRRTVLLPRTNRRTAEDAEVVLGFVLEDRKLSFVVLPTPGSPGGHASDEFLGHLLARLNDSGETQLVFEGQNLLIFRSAAGPSPVADSS